MIDTTHSASLCERTQQLVKDRPAHVTYAQLSERSGVPVRWIEKFASNKIADPGCSKVERLYEALTGRRVLESC